MRAPYVTENTIDMASDINDSMRVLDGCTPMAVESITSDLPAIGTASIDKYYAKTDGTVWITDRLKQYWQKCLTPLIIYEDALLISKDGNWVNVKAPDVMGGGGKADPLPTDWLTASPETPWDIAASFAARDAIMNEEKDVSITAVKLGTRNRTSSGITTVGSLALMVSRNVGGVWLYNYKTDLEIESTSHGQTSTDAFYGAVNIGASKVLLVPRNASKICVYDAQTNTVHQGPSHGKGVNAYAGGALLPDGKVLLVPNDSNAIGIYDPINDTLDQTLLHGQGSRAYSGACYTKDGEKIILVPRSANKVGIYDIASGTFSTGDTLTQTSLSSAFIGGVTLPSGKIIFIPYEASGMGIYDPEEDKYTDGYQFEFSANPGYALGGALMMDGRVLLSPWGSNAPGLPIYDPVADTIEWVSIIGGSAFLYGSATVLPSGDYFLAGNSDRVIVNTDYKEQPALNCMHPLMHVL